MNKKINLLLCALTLILFSEVIYSQEVQSPSLSFNRGKLWQSVYNGKIAPPFNNWRRTGIGLDWPGFDPNWVNMNLGGAPSYMLTGGFIVGCKKSEDSVLAVDDWALSGGSIANDNGSKYIITKHKKTFDEKGNYWLALDPNKGEEVIETTWEYNQNYSDAFGMWHQIPIRVNRVAHQWSGSKRDENYIIYEYTFKNISDEVKNNLAASGDSDRIKTIPDTLKSFYAMLSYALHANSRAWTVNFPQETPGAKNTWFFRDTTNKVVYGRASDYKATAVIEREYGFSFAQGLVLPKGLGGEYLAPGIVGVKLLYSSINDNGQTTNVKEYGWSAGDNSYDFAGPLSGKSTLQSEFDIFTNQANVNNYVKSSADTTLMRRSRMWSLMTLGPWTLKPGDSVKIAMAEIVDGADYKLALDSSAANYSAIGGISSKLFNSSMKKAQFTYDNKFRHPNPPPAPDFSIDYYRGRERFVANQITWQDTYDNYHDPLDPAGSLVGYKVYRSSFLPIGPWDSAGVVLKKDLKNYNPATGTYTFIDSTVVVGASYYYSLTAYDTTRGTWAVNPSAVFEETGSTKVPSMESSIYANKKITKFTSTIPATKNLSEVVVVPNPFVLGKGRTQPGEGDNIQFYNLPNPCTIRIYTIRGDLLKTIDVPYGHGAIASWNQVTDYGQFVKSGMYIFHIDSGSETKVGKFSIIR